MFLGTGDYEGAQRPVGAAVRIEAEYDPLDLLDMNPNCDQNIWGSNTSGTAQPQTCIH